MTRTACVPCSLLTPTHPAHTGRSFFSVDLTLERPKDYVTVEQHMLVSAYKMWRDLPQGLPNMKRPCDEAACRAPRCGLQ